MRDQKLTILFWELGALMVPPVFWLLFGWFFQIWTLQEMMRIILSPWIWVYVAFFSFIGLFVVYRWLKIVESVKEKKDEEMFKKARGILRVVPIFVLFLISFYCVIGPNVALLGQTLHNPFLDRIEYVFAELLGIPLILLFTVIFYIMVIKSLERFSKGIPLSEDAPFLSIRGKMTISIVLNLIGSVLTLWIASLSLSYGGADFKTFIFKLGVMGVTVILISFFNLWVLLKQITTPIYDIKGRMLLILDGLVKRKLDLSEEVLIDSRDEIGILAQSFNRMLESLAVLMQYFRDQSIRAKESGEVLKAVSNQSLQSLDEVKENTENMVQQFGEMKETVQTSRNQAKEVKSFVSQMVLEIRDQNQSIRESDHLIQAIDRSVASLSDMARENKETAGQLEELAVKGEKLIHRSEKEIEEVYQSAHLIGDLLGVIDDIADRTGMLAMNAAIEAAHAGEAGKGFSIVASEIRKLAENTAKNSSNIASSLETIVDRIRISKESSEETASTFEDMMTNIRRLAEGMGIIESSMKEMQSENRQVVEHLKILDELAKKVDQDSDEVGSKMESIFSSYEVLSDLFERNEQRLALIGDSIHKLNLKMKELTDAGELTFKNSLELEELLVGFKV